MRDDELWVALTPVGAADAPVELVAPAGLQRVGVRRWPAIGTAIVVVALSGAGVVALLLPPGAPVVRAAARPAHVAGRVAPVAVAAAIPPALAPAPTPVVVVRTRTIVRTRVIVEHVRAPVRVRTVVVREPARTVVERAPAPARTVVERVPAPAIEHVAAPLARPAVPVVRTAPVVATVARATARPRPASCVLGEFGC